MQIHTSRSAPSHLMATTGMMSQAANSQRGLLLYDAVVAIEMERSLGFIGL